MREGAKVVTNQIDRLVPLDIARRRQQLRLRHQPHFDEEASNRVIRYCAKQGTKGNRDKAESERDAPLATTNMSDLESGATDEDNEDLDSNLCEEVSEDKLISVIRSTYRSG